MCSIPLVQGCPQKKPPGRADSKPRHCVVFWDSDLVVVRHHHQSQRNRCAMKQVSTTKYLTIMQYPFLTVSWIMNASVYKRHFEVWLSTKQHGFGNGVNQDSPRYPKIRPGSLRESSWKPSRHHLCSQKDLFQPVHWSRRWSPVSRGGGSPANDDGILSIWGYRVQWCVYFVCMYIYIYMCVCIYLYNSIFISNVIYIYNINYVLFISRDLSDYLSFYLSICLSIYLIYLSI